MDQSSSVYFLFIDGIGIGPGGEHNPFDVFDLPGFMAMGSGKPLIEGKFGAEATLNSDEPWLIRPIDANLGVEGLPQSGTGQSTLFTGVNCAAVAGRHYGPFPHSTSRPILADRNLFHQVGPDRSAFANAYPERFFEWANKRNRWSTTTRCCLDSGVRIRTLDDLRSGDAISADLTGEGLARVAASTVPVQTENESARIIGELTRTNRLVVSEYFHTDKAGHAQSADMARHCLESIDRFLTALLDHLDFSSTTFVLTSDHGNLEDLSTKTHTLNPVPLMVRGPGAKEFANVTDLTGVAGGILRSLDIEPR